MNAKEIGLAVLNSENDEEMTSLINSMTDYQKIVMIKALASMVRKVQKEEFSVFGV